MIRQGVNSNGEPMRSLYVEHDPVDLDCSCEPSLTRQEFAEECDINNIMDKYKTTGALTHINSQSPRYFDFSEAPDFASALTLLKDAEEAFLRVPSKVRAEFDNDPVKFVAYAEDAENLPKLREWGLAPPEKAPDAPMRVEVVNPPLADAAAPKA